MILPDFHSEKNGAFIICVLCHVAEFKYLIMGGCLGRCRTRRSRIGDPPEDSTSMSAVMNRRNQPLRRERVRWKSDVPLTGGQLRSKRDEFWETAPAFEGRKEIWDALHAASKAVESFDFQLAQALIDGANISLPHGLLTECYDELGTRYQVPVYCLSYPINMVKEGNGQESPEEIIDDTKKGEEIELKIRLSFKVQDIKFPVVTTDSIGVAKKKLQIVEEIDPSNQRWFFGGKLLADKLRIEDLKLEPGFVIQVIVNNVESKNS